MSWEWDASDEPVLVYLMCINHKRSEPSLSGLEFGVAVSWAGVPPFFPRTLLGQSSDAVIRPIVTSFETGETPFISWPIQDDGAVPPDDPDDPIGTVNPTPPLLDIAVTQLTPSLTASVTSEDPQSGAAIDGPPLFDNPIDPSGSLPVPESATWILLATGLGVAWKFRRRHR